MKTWVAVGAVMLAAAPAFAQQQQEDPVERSVQRLKDQLTLTDEQVSKVRDIVKKEREDVKAVLTDAQKTTYDQGGGRGNRPGGNNNGNNGNNGGNAPGANGFAGIRGGAWLPATNDLKTSLSLTDDQVTKINEIRDAVRQEMRTYFQNHVQRMDYPTYLRRGWQIGVTAPDRARAETQVAKAASGVGERWLKIPANGCKPRGKLADLQLCPQLVKRQPAQKLVAEDGGNVEDEAIAAARDQERGEDLALRRQQGAGLQLTGAERAEVGGQDVLQKRFCFGPKDLDERAIG